MRTPPPVRAERAAPIPKTPAPLPTPHTEQPGAQPPNPYLDYGRFLTPEGGVLIVYKGFDERLRHALWAIFAWSLFSGGEFWLVKNLHQPNGWSWVLLFGAVVLNLVIVAKPVEAYHRLEIRPDCMILDGTDLFWAGMIEDMPKFNPAEDGDYSLTGTYGTRLVEFLILHRFDEFDRTPEVFSAHLAHAIEQLWMRPT